MYKNFILTESEKEQILNMHKNHGYGKKLREGDDEKYFARHGEGNIPWTGSSNKTYGDLPDGDYDDETYDDFDTLHATHPEFHSHYSGKGNVDRAKHMFDTYKRSQGPLLVKKRRIQTEQPLNEQSPQLTQKDYQEIANYFKGLMSGVNITSDASDKIETTIVNRINNKKDWEGVKRAFGVQDGQNLDQWLKGEFRIDFNRVMQLVNQKEGEFRKQDSMYNPGTKLRLITNRQFVMGRAYNYASSMRDKEEMNIDMENATVIRRDKDGIVVKVPYVYYYNVGERQRGGPIPKQERMDNPCIKIPFSEIIEFRDDTLQVSWFSDWVKSRVVPCK